jgi:hypothetical protein
MNEQRYDKVSHYAEGRIYEPKDVIMDWGLNFNLGNVVKYVSRAGRKEGASLKEDLEKAKQYLEYELDYINRNGYGFVGNNNNVGGDPYAN